MTYKYTFFLAIIYIVTTAFSCDPIIIEQDPIDCELGPELQEISGMIPFGGGILAFGDSGSQASLYEVDSCVIINEFKITEATNTDWEAIAEDDDYIYVGDFGNNRGDRKDLHIIKIFKSELQSETPIHTIINFRYEDQVEFGNDELHNFDCEAMVIDGDRIILFTKNRGNHITHLYELNNQDTSQIARRHSEIEISDLVTGAFFDKQEGRVLLTSYSRFFETSFTPYLYYFDFDLEAENIITNINKRDLPNNFQIESVCLKDDELYFASEAELVGNAVLFIESASSFIR